MEEKTQNLFLMYKNITRYKLYYITIAQRGLMAFSWEYEIQQNKWMTMNPADHLSQIVYTDIHAGHIYQPGPNYPSTVSP